MPRFAADLSLMHGEHHDPDGGEVDFFHLFEPLDALGYAGFAGREYRPRGGTSADLGRLRRWRDTAGS